MNKKKPFKLAAWLLSVMMVFTMMPAVAFAAETPQGEITLTDDEEQNVTEIMSSQGETDSEEEPEAVNQAPVLADGVAPEVTEKVLTGDAFLLKDLQAGKIFVDPEGDKLSPEGNYFYVKSTDGGKTWSGEQTFAESLFGATTIQLTENKAGVYIYRFYAKDSQGASSADNDVYWTLTLHVVDQATWDTSFFVGQDMNYKTNGNVYPEIRVYKTAGVNNDKSSAEYNFDYVGKYVKDGETQFVYDPADYIISGNAKDGWKIQESEEGEKYQLKDYEPVEFTDSSFGLSEDGEESSTVDGGYNMFYAQLENGYYSYRGYGYNSETQKYDVKLGGMQLKIPTDKNVDGNAGGGTNIYLRLAPIYTNSKKTDNTYFNADEYHAALVCPIMKCSVQPGTPYVSGNYTYYPFLVYAGGNSCLYNKYVYPDIDGYIFNQAINATFATGNSVIASSMTISPAVKLNVTVPEDADFGLYFQYNNFNTSLVEPSGKPVVNDDETVTIPYSISKSNGNYTWRLENPDGRFVTKAGWLTSVTEPTEIKIDFDEDSATNLKSHSFKKLGSTTKTRDEADIQVNLDPSGYKAVGKDKETRIRAYRHWELINSDTANIMIEPDFNWTVLDGKASIKEVDGGNASSNWADVDPDGTAIVAVDYDAIDVYADNKASTYSSHGGLYPATSQNRTGVFVISDEEKGSADAHIKYNNDGTEQTRSEEWDYNYDTWYFDSEDNNPELEFTVDGKGTEKVYYATVETASNGKSRMSFWKKAEADENGKYIASLEGLKDSAGGTVIIKMKDSTGVSYRLVRVAEVKVTVANESNPGMDITPGDTVKLSFDGLYRAVNKQSGIFNPTTFYARYTSGDAEVNGKTGQYQQMDTTEISLKIPENVEFPEGKNETEHAFTNGYVFGSMYSAANPFRFLYEMTDTGVGTNFNAVTVSLCFQHLSDVKVNVVKKTLNNIKLNITDGDNPVEGVELVLKNSAGETLTADEGIYKNLPYGSYSYEATKEGYLKSEGSFKLSKSETPDEEGLIVEDVVIKPLEENQWDGKTLTEPAEEEGVYQIGTGAELAWFANAVNSGSTSAKAVLTADIDLAGGNWTSIGTSANKFAGTFDGQGHKITHMNIDVSGTKAADVQYKGLFGYVMGTASAHAVIKNLKVGGSVKLKCTGSVASANSAAVAGYAKYADFSMVVNAAQVTAVRSAGNWQYVGGIAGNAEGCNFEKCANAGDVSGYQYVGGIAGYSKTTVFEQCINDGDITAGTTYGAGIVTYLSDATSKVEECYNTGTVKCGTNYAAGIVSYVKVAGTNVVNCFNYGYVDCEGANSGLLIGNINVAGVNVTNCYCMKQGDMKAVGADKSSVAVETVSEGHMASEAFTDAINAGTDVFAQGKNHPIFKWFSDWNEESCNHKLRKHEKVEETCITDGLEESWTCSLCDKYFGDSEAATEINKSDLVIKAHGLKYVGGKEATCTEEGSISHYVCKNKECGKLYKDKNGAVSLDPEDIIRAPRKHNMTKTDAVPATFDEEGIEAYWECSRCNGVFSDEDGNNEIKAIKTINCIDKVELSESKFAYTGKAISPEVTATDVEGKLIPASDYSIDIEGTHKNVGTYKVTVSFKNNYSGSADLSFKINPTKTKITKLTKKKKSVVVKWKGNLKQVDGYQIRYAKSKSFKNAKKVKVDGKAKTSRTIKKLASKKKYYFEVRTYKKVSGETYYSAWSSVKSQTAK